MPLTVFDTKGIPATDATGSSMKFPGHDRCKKIQIAGAVASVLGLLWKIGRGVLG